MDRSEYLELLSYNNTSFSENIKFIPDLFLFEVIVIKPDSNVMKERYFSTSTHEQILPNF